MYLSILRLWNFRKYAGADNKPGLEIHFQKGVNVLIGENDSGKTAIVDAIRYVLRTQSGEFIQFEDKDFYQDSDGNRKDEFKIYCAVCIIRQGLQIIPFYCLLCGNRAAKQQKNV